MERARVCRLAAGSSHEHLHRAVAGDGYSRELARCELRQWWRDRLSNAAKNFILLAGLVVAAGLGLVAMSWEPASPRLAARLQSIRECVIRGKLFDVRQVLPRLFSGVTRLSVFGGMLADQASLETLAALAGRAVCHALRD